MNLPELLRYGINGVIATLVLFTALTFNLEILMMRSAGLANVLAAVAGITASFLGSRYFVFSTHNQGIGNQAIIFFGLYGLIALLHGLVLLIWTDWLGLDYRPGFLLATALQVSLSYAGNKFLVFKA